MDREEYAQSIVRYVMGHDKFLRWTRERVAYETVKVMLDDIGAAQGFCQAIGLKVDLYEDTYPVDPTERRNLVTEPHVPLPAPSTGTDAEECLSRYYHEHTWTNVFCYLPMNHIGRHESRSGYVWN